MSSESLINEIIKELEKLPNPNLATVLDDHINKIERQIREMDNWFYKHHDCNWIAMRDADYKGESK